VKPPAIVWVEVDPDGEPWRVELHKEAPHIVGAQMFRYVLAPVRKKRKVKQ
jgi:hypothetical protein